MSFAQSVIRVYNGNPTQGGTFVGTAFFIKPQVLLSANHVFKLDCPNGAFLQLPEGEVWQAPTSAIEHCKTSYGERDIALVYLSRAFNAYCPLVAKRNPESGDAVTLWGFFDAVQSVHQRPTHISGYVGVQHAFNLSGSIPRGMSGGAVLFEDQLIGLIYARDADKNIAYCIPIDEIRACLGETPLEAPSNTNYTDLERAATVFVGREAELAQLKAAFCSANQTPVAITAVQGMAGVGKSWLADHFYVTHQAEFAGGYQRFSLNVEALPKAGSLLGELADRLKLAAPPAHLAALVANRLRQPRTLLHIENVDSEAAAALVGEFCGKLPDCPIILSGRMEGLGKARRWQQIPLKPFQHQDALAQLNSELKCLQAKAIPDQEALQLVKVLGGLPLAIHLAAGYLAKSYGVREFLHELNLTGFALTPEDPTDDVFTRDRARAVLQSTFQISLKLLAQQGQSKGLTQADQTFAHLGYAPSAGFGMSIASALLNLDEDTSRVLLRAAHKLALIDLQQAEPLRWQLHPLLAHYLRQLAAENESQARLNQWFLSRLLEPQETEDKVADYSPWHELNLEHAALAEWLAALPSDLCSAVEQAGTIYARQNGPFLAWTEMLQGALQAGVLDDQQRSNLLFTLADVSQRSGNLDLALDSAKQKQALDEQRDEERGATLAKGQIADILQDRGQLDEALRIRQHEELPVYERLGAVREIAITQGQIADILQARGQLDEALRIRTRDQLPVYERLGEVREIAITQGQIADILQARGQLDEALRIRQHEELPVYERLGEVRSIAITQGKIADIYFEQGKHSEAIRIREEVLPIYEALGDKRMLLVDQTNLAIRYLQTGANFAKAKQLLHIALKSAHEMQIPEAGQIEAILEQLG